MAKARNTVVDNTPVCTLTAAQVLTLDETLLEMSKLLLRLRNVMGNVQPISAVVSPPVALPPLPVPEMPPIPGLE